MRAHPRRVYERAADLPVERRRARIAAYVYGNILVLAAVLTATPATIENGHAAVVVLATTGTTYLAHVVAEAVATAVGRDGVPPRLERAELRDALPILSSGSAPTVILLVGAITALDTGLAEVAAAAVVVVRLLGIGSLVSHYGEPHTRPRVRGLGAALALVSAVIVALKLVLLH